MKLLYFIPALYNSGGMERVLSEKMNYLVREYNNYEIIVVTTEQLGRPVFFPLDEQIKQIHLDIDFNNHYQEPLLKKFIHHKQKLKSYKKNIIQILSEHKPDICISLCGKEIEFLYKIKDSTIKIAEIHFSMNVREQFISRKGNYLWKMLGKIRTLQLKKQTKSLDKLVVLTQNDKKQWEKTHKNIIVISNPNPLKPKEYLYNNESRTVISVGRLDYQKGYDRLIDTWKIVAEKYPDWQLNIFGSGEDKNALTKQIKQNHLEKDIHLKGISNKIEEEYYKSSFYVMSSRYEGLPMVLIEAMACGLPAISFDCEHGPREIIVNDMNGFLVPAFDINGLAEKIILLIENEEKRIEMSFNAYETVKTYNISAIMKQWDTLFHSLIS
ncbi:glycosyltransferase family 4 protein [Paludibacter sp. 221]|uniref:glycosyltransferase family 4 protein n=1 Tax=Paludibacter sp. 221 TaxID=2302939 RepID=UPI0013D359C6|nr:glycosyltransferase family 4 protein [Paludibacter sp. 221]NDV47268.1 glycosyltransferase family 4 protein [Paludibacter sp. 221]